jgi:predicted  nucleic acid-binding Zn-ribbon protein
MFNQSSTMIFNESTQIAVSIFYLLGLIGVVWKVAVDHSKTKHELKNLKDKQDEIREQQEKECSAHKEEHTEIKQAMNSYQGALQEIRFDLHSNNIQFKTLEVKLEGIQTSIVNLQSDIQESRTHQNEVTKELISTIKNMDNERRKNNV